MFHWDHMMLNTPWNFICSRIGWHWSCLWGKLWSLKIMPGCGLVCGWLYCQPKETMLSPYQLWLDGWRVCLNFAMDFSGDFVVDDPLIFCYFLEGGFAVNIFRFGSHSCSLVSPSLLWFNLYGIVFTKFSVLELFWSS